MGSATQISLLKMATTDPLVFLSILLRSSISKPFAKHERVFVTYINRLSVNKRASVPN